MRKKEREGEWCWHPKEERIEGKKHRQTDRRIMWERKKDTEREGERERERKRMTERQICEREIKTKIVFEREKEMKWV